MPKMIEVHEPDWPKHGFNSESALKVVAADDESFDYFINMDNLYLLNESKALQVDQDPKLLQHKFKYAMVLLGMMILKEMDKDDEADAEHSLSAEDTACKFSSMVAPVILPMIDALGDLDIND